MCVCVCVCVLAGACMRSMCCVQMCKYPSRLTCGISMKGSLCLCTRKKSAHIQDLDVQGVSYGERRRSNKQLM